MEHVGDNGLERREECPKERKDESPSREVVISIRGESNACDDWNKREEFAERDGRAGQKVGEDDGEEGRCRSYNLVELKYVRIVIDVEVNSRTGTVTNCKDRFETAILTVYNTLKLSKLTFCLAVSLAGICLWVNRRVGALSDAYIEFIVLEDIASHRATQSVNRCESIRERKSDEYNLVVQRQPEIEEKVEGEPEWL